MNPRQRKFAIEYVRNGFVGYAAIAAAGYHMGYNAACVEASRLLRKPKINAMIDEHLKRHKLTADEVAEELSRVATADVPLDAPAKLKALDLLAKVHGMITVKSEVARVDNRDSQVNQARASFALAALPELQTQHPDWTVDQLKQAAEQRFTAWYDALQVEPVTTDTIQ